MKIDYPLHVHFLEQLEENGIEVGEQFLYAGKSDWLEASVNDLLAQIIGLYRRNPASLSIPLLLNVHSELGDRIIATLDSLLL